MLSGAADRAPRGGAAGAGSGAGYGGRSSGCVKSVVLVCSRGTHSAPPTSEPPILPRRLVVITATDLELRAGSRILLSGAAPARPARRPDRPRRPQRRGQDHELRVLAGEGEPYAGAVPAPASSATCRRTPARATCPSAAQGPGALGPRPRRAAPRDGEGADGDGRARRRGRSRQRRAPLRQARGAVLGARRVRRRERGRADLLQPRPRPTGSSPSRCARCPVVSAGAWSSPASCSPPPTPARAAGRARSCCSTSPPTTSTPTRSPGCAASSRGTAAASW